MFKKVLTTAVLTATIVAGPATAAFAHDCFVVHRSGQGALNASHSPRWFSFTLTEALQYFMNVPEENLQAAYDEAVAAGVPTAFASRTDKLLLEGSTAASTRTGDGKGIDYFESSPVIQTLFEIALKYGGSVGEE